MPTSRRKFLGQTAFTVAALSSSLNGITLEALDALPCAEPSQGPTLAETVPVRFADVGPIKLAYLDVPGTGTPIVALHGLFSRGATFSPLAKALAGRHRLIAVDQRGHGQSDKPEDYSRAAFVEDIATLIGKVGLGPVILLGHSLGGLNSYQLAAKHPELVKALIIEDIGTTISADFSFMANWPIRFQTHRDLHDFLEQKFNSAFYFMESATEYPDGWGLRFDYRHMIAAGKAASGDWWQDFAASKCPALLIHGHKSFALNTAHARDICRRRANTKLLEFSTSGHTIHDDDPAGFNNAVIEFLKTV